MKDYLTYLPFLIKAKTIDQLDSPLLASLCTDIIYKLSSTERKNLSEHREHIQAIQTYFNKSQVIILMQNDQIKAYSDLLVERWANVLILSIDRNDLTEGPRKINLASHFNLDLDFYHFRIFTHDSRILVPIQMKVLPFHSRWKLGIFR